MTKYRMLRVGEIRRASDEFNKGSANNPNFVLTICSGTKMLHSDVGYYRRPLKIKETRKPASNKPKVAICAQFIARKRCAWFCDRYCRSAACRVTRKHATVR